MFYSSFKISKNLKVKVLTGLSTPTAKMKQQRTKAIVIGKKSPMSLAGRVDDSDKSQTQEQQQQYESPEYFEVFLSRVDINETDESIMTHLHKLTLSFRDFKRIKPWQTHYLSFYFKVDFNQKDIVLDKNNWPHRVLVRECVQQFSRKPIFNDDKDVAVCFWIKK